MIESPAVMHTLVRAYFQLVRRGLQGSEAATRQAERLRATIRDSWSTMASAETEQQELQQMLVRRYNKIFRTVE